MLLHIMNCNLYLYLFYINCLDTVRGNYMAKKLKMEKQVHDLNLSSIDVELKRIKNKILRTPFTPKVKYLRVL